MASTATPFAAVLPVTRSPSNTRSVLSDTEIPFSLSWVPMGFHGTTTLRNEPFVTWQFSAKSPGFSPAKEQIITSAYLLSRRPAGFRTNRSWVSYCPAALTWTNTAMGGGVRLTLAPGFKRNQRPRFSFFGPRQGHSLQGV